MKKFGFAALLGSTLSAAVIGLAAPAHAAPGAPGDGRDHVTTIESLGYSVANNPGTIDALKRD